MMVFQSCQVFIVNILTCPVRISFLVELRSHPRTANMSFLRDVDDTDDVINMLWNSQPRGYPEILAQ